MDITTAYLMKQPHYKPGTPGMAGLGFVVVIPCYDEPDIQKTLNALRLCDRPEAAVEVIVVLNAPENADRELLARQEATHKQLLAWAQLHDDPAFRLLVLNVKNLPEKFAGAGLARKLGMDEAVGRFSLVQDPHGIICSMDADTLCDQNYFTEIENHMRLHPEMGGGTLYFEHPLEGDEFEPEVYHGVTLYELHMRYYLQALRSTGFPYAHHTLGSAFFVTAETYVRCGGMNRRKAGEDFYFLHKVFPMVPFIDLTGTRVVPSPRPSHRVPFGTGPWIRSYLTEQERTLNTYHYGAFMEMKSFFEMVTASGTSDICGLYASLPDALRTFISKEEFEKKLGEIKANTASRPAFIKRFYTWFNGLKMVKFLNHAHRAHYQKPEILQQASGFLREVMNVTSVPEDPKGVLEIYRRLERHIR